MSVKPSTQVVLLTPPGRGAVATLAIEGPCSLEIAEALFYPANGRPLADARYGLIRVGRWQSRETGEDLVVCPKNDRRVEIHCHGGQAALTAIIASLVERGCHVVPWDDWLSDSNLDPITAAARIALSRAATEQTAAVLWDQAKGALRRALDSIAIQIEKGQISHAKRHIGELIERASLGQHLVTPWRVLTIGLPNVGKSSLINALLGYPRAIVHETPGTTRDVVTTLASLDGWPVELSDTAGLRESIDPLEALGVQLAYQRSQTADLVLLVVDATRSSLPEVREMANRWPTSLQVLNKCDLPGERPMPEELSQILRVSALRGDGIRELEHAIVTRLVPKNPPHGAGVPFTFTQAEKLRHVRRIMDSGDHDLARELLSRREGLGVDC